MGSRVWRGPHDIAPVRPAGSSHLEPLKKLGVLRDVGAGDSRGPQGEARVGTQGDPRGEMVLISSRCTDTGRESLLCSESTYTEDLHQIVFSHR